MTSQDAILDIHVTDIDQASYATRDPEIVLQLHEKDFFIIGSSLVNGTVISCVLEVQNEPNRILLMCCSHNFPDSE